MSARIALLLPLLLASIAAPLAARDFRCTACDRRPQNGVRFTYPVSMIDLALAGRCAGRTPAKRWVLASTIARKASRP